MKRVSVTAQPQKARKSATRNAKRSIAHTLVTYHPTTLAQLLAQFCLHFAQLHKARKLRNAQRGIAHTLDVNHMVNKKRTSYVDSNQTIPPVTQSD
jgi:hypothetical protein